MSALAYVQRDFDLPYIGRRSFQWPEGDKVLWKWVNQVAHLEIALPLIKKRNICVQAGGGCGVWPLALAKLFGVVYTFEPFLPNFRALSVNCFNDQNIVALNAALGNQRGCVDMGWHKAGFEINYGAQYIKDKGPIPVLRLDDLGLDECNFLCLDIEGAEMMALRGGQETITRCRPVIMLEDAGHERNFGGTTGEAAGLVSRMGYKRAGMIRNDSVFIPND